MSSDSSSSSPSAAVARLRHAAHALQELTRQRDAAALARSHRRAKKPDDPGNPALTRACAACRTAKVKCLPSAQRRCARCAFSDLDCIFPEPSRRGPKMSSRAPDALDEVLSDVNAALTALECSNVSSTCTALSDTRNRSNTVEDEEEAEMAEEEACDAWRNPWSVLNVVNVNRMASTLLSSDNTLYSARPECDSELDPVSLGILSEPELDRLIQSYFESLRPYFWHLEPNLHTARFLRLNSPFLTTAIAAAAASFDPLATTYASALLAHAHYLANDAFVHGYKSLEVAQGYAFMTHWAPIKGMWSEDRNWQYHHESMRIATDIRLDQSLHPSTLAQYHVPEGMAPGEFVSSLERTRARTWTLLCCGDLAISVQSGRLCAVSGLHLSGGLRCEILPTDDNDPDMNYNANETLNRLFARAIYLWNGLQDEAATDDEDLRKSFLAAWEPLMSRWEDAYPSRNYFMNSLMLSGYFMIVLGLNMRLMLTLFALRFRAPAKETRELLKRCWELALSTLSVVAEWAQEARAREALVYASNYVLLNIAYGSVLALKLASTFDRSPSSTLRTKCETVANVLLFISSFRANAVSFAGHYAAKINLLLNEGHTETTTAPATSSPSILDHDRFDLSEFSLETLDEVDFADIMSSFSGAVGAGNFTQTG